MPAKPFKKGHKKIGGRAKGAKNKFTTLKDAFLNTFQAVGGEVYLRNFAKSPTGKKDFIRAIASMLPKDIHMSGAEGAPLIPPVIQFVGVASDGNGNTSIPSSNTKDSNAVSVPGDIEPEGTL